MIIEISMQQFDLREDWGYDSLAVCPVSSLSISWPAEAIPINKPVEYARCSVANGILFT